MPSDPRASSPRPGYASSAHDALIVSIRSKSVGDTIRLKILRDGAPVDVTMTLQAATG